MKRFLLWIVCLLFACRMAPAENDDILTRTIEFAKTQSSVYEALNRLSEQTGYYFIYDSNVVDNEKKIKIPRGDYVFSQLIRRITTNNELQMRLVGKHILLYKATPPTPVITRPDSVLLLPQFLLIEGTVRDKQKGDPIPYCSVSLPEAGIGTITNRNGHFMLKLADSLQQQPVYFSHVGYEQQQIPAALLAGKQADFYLETRVIPIQEIIVRMVNPERIVKEMLEKRPLNYTSDPVYFTTFYREGIERNNNSFVNLTEAVFKIYKSPFNSILSADQVKLLKMRKISNTQITDTIILKMKAGIRASLTLDLVKNLPDFLSSEESNAYTYSKIDMAVTDSSLAHVIAFEQKPETKNPLYKGELYIDANNAALLSARFEIDPRYIDKATDMFILRKSRGINIKPRKASYTVSYKYWQGNYYLNHIRGDVSFRIKKSKRFFPTTINTYFEMATCKIDTTDVKRFPRREGLPLSNIFSDISFSYDHDFWKDFNVILPEENLNEAILRVSSKIEEQED